MTPTKLTLERLSWMESVVADEKYPPALSSREFMELVAAAAYALHVGYAGSIAEQRRVNEFQAALDE